MTRIVVPYLPRTAFLPFHSRTQQEAIMVCHRRAGKTVAIANDAQRRCLTNPRRQPPPKYAWFYPTRVRAKDIAWNYLKYYAKPIPGVRFKESELTVEYPHGGTVTLYGADNARGVGLYLDGVYYDEADEIPRQTVVDVAPALADRAGFAVYAGMLKGRYNLWKRYSEAITRTNVFTLMLRASESGIIAPGELERLKSTMGEAAYRMQLECDPNASIANAIYGREMDNLRKDGRLKPLQADPSHPLYAFADVGHSNEGDDWAWWLVQLVGRDIIFLDYYARTGEIPAHYVGVLRGWEDTYRQRIETVYLPHDGSQKNQVGKSTEDYLRDAGLTRIRVVPRTPDLWNSINNFRALLARVWINAGPCQKPWILGELEMPSGVDCLDFYTKKEDRLTGMITEVPVHNQYSHGADAARTFAEAYALKMLEGTSEMAEAGRRAEVRVTREPNDRSQPRRFVVTR